MILVCCLDKNNGMLFNHRRISKDRVIIEDIKSFSTDSKIYIDFFSKDLLEQGIISKDLFKEKISSNDYCFIEDIKPSLLETKINRIIIYNFNRNYPSDFKFDIDLRKWSFVESTELKGHSHEVITKTIYERGQQ